MATPDIKQFSVTELERLLVRRSAELSKLERERTKLRKRLSSLEVRIVAVGGTAAEGRVRAASRKGLPRHKNPKSLKVLVVEILRENKKGLNLTDLTAKVLKTGYKTSSGNFSNTVYQAVYNSKGVSYDEAAGLYRAK